MAVCGRHIFANLVTYAGSRLVGIGYTFNGLLLLAYVHMCVYVCIYVVVHTVRMCAHIGNIHTVSMATTYYAIETLLLGLGKAVAQHSELLT